MASLVYGNARSMYYVVCDNMTINICIHKIYRYRVNTNVLIFMYYIVYITMVLYKCRWTILTFAPSIMSNSTFSIRAPYTVYTVHILSFMLMVHTQHTAYTKRPYSKFIQNRDQYVMILHSTHNCRKRGEW